MRKRYILGGGCGIVLLGLIGLGVYYLIVRSRTHGELERIIAELDDTDPGWRRDDLDRERLKVPADENSGPIILKLNNRIPAKWAMQDPESHWDELWPNEPLPHADAARFQQRMTLVTDIVTEARRLADKPRGCYSIAWAPDSVSTLLPHLQQVREVGTLLFHDAVWQAHSGKQTLALESCRAEISVGRTAETEPTLISQLVRNACLREALAGLHRTLGAGSHADAASLLAVQQALAEADKHEAIVVGLRGERASSHEMCTNLQNGTVSSRALLGTMGARGGRGSLTDRVEEVYITASVPASHVWLLRHFTDAIAATKLPAAEQDARMKELHRDPIAAPALAKVFAPAWIRCYETFRRDRAKLRCAMVALAVERYRLKHGAWPDDLAALMPEFIAAIPADPYTDQPVKYRMAPNGVSVYSVGPDRAFEGNFFDGQRPIDPALVPNPPPSAFEFRLWDPDARLRPR
jgi:hypothetical protein